jgi:hypothetical protein
VPPESKQHGIFRQIRRRIVWSTIPTFVTLVTLAIELLGGWRFGKDMYSEKYAINLGPLYRPLMLFVVAVVTLAPILIAQGFVMAFSKWGTLRLHKGWLTALLFC